MDLNIIHLAMELSAAACLFFISWLNIHYCASGKYSTIVAVGTAIAGFADLLHATSITVFPDLLAHWIPLSWGTTRLSLLMMFGMIVLCYDKINCTVPRVTFLLTLPLVASLTLGFLQSDISWVYAPFDLFGLIIYRPFDFVLLVGWSVMALALKPQSQYLFPPHTYWPFMIQGILIHAIMSFVSTESLDIGFMLAHALKISEYYTFILIYLMYKNHLDNFIMINTSNNRLSGKGNI